MRSMLRLLKPLPVLLVLSLAASPSCCKRQLLPDPVRPVQALRSCVTPEIRADRPKPIAEALMTCSDQGNSPEDCIAHDDKVREAYIVRLLANCGAKQ